jgi:hypothetical protein
MLKRRTTAILALVIFLVIVAGAVCLERRLGTNAGKLKAIHPETFDPFPPGYGEKVAKITALLNAAATSQPSATDANDLLNEAANDPDHRIRIRAMDVLPFVQDRERVIDVLIAATRVRDRPTSGGGNVPLHAATYLADMKAVRAIPAVADWVRFLQDQASV